MVPLQKDYKMNCFSRKRKQIKENSVHPHPMAEEKVTASFMDKFLREAMCCGNCKQIFNLDSNELKIHCNICNQFFHCGIAGKCIGDNCKQDGSEHRASYCNSCVSKIYSNGTCLCKECF